MVRLRPNAEKWRVCAELEELAIALDRPVCSADLRQRFRESPERAPLLTQRLGLVLAKTARERPTRGIWPVGRFGFHTYYAPDPSDHWEAKLQRHRLRHTVLARIAEDIPGYVMKLLGTEHELLASNAFAGFVEECAALIADPLLADWKPLDELLPFVEVSRRHAAPRFEARTPRDLIDRATAERLLVREYRQRMDDEATLSTKRHLVGLRWPQTSVLPPVGLQRFCRRQLQAYASAHWPLEIDEGEISTALWMAFRYGEATA